MNKLFFIVLAFIVALPCLVNAQSSTDGTVIENASALLTRHQQRMDILEAGLKDVRGIIENDLREIKMKVEQMQSSSSEAGTSQTADLKALRDQMEKLGDMLAMTNRRMERTLEITSDTEFRLLRLEKRMQTLLTLGGDDAAAALVQQDTIGAGEAAAVQMSRDVDTGISSWSVEENSLNDALANVEGDNATDKVSAVDENAGSANTQDQPSQRLLRATMPSSRMLKPPVKPSRHSLKYCQLSARKSNIASHLDALCKMIWKRLSWHLLNSGLSITVTRGRLILFSGSVGCNLCVANLKRRR